MSLPRATRVINKLNGQNRQWDGIWNERVQRTATGWSFEVEIDDEDAIAPVAALAKQLGFAPVKLGKLNEGGALVHARGRTWGPLIFQDLFKKEQ